MINRSPFHDVNLALSVGVAKIEEALNRWDHRFMRATNRGVGDYLAPEPSDNHLMRIPMFYGPHGEARYIWSL